MSGDGAVALDAGVELHVGVASDPDIVAARQQGRALAAQVGFPNTDQTMIATAISELARNIVVYAQRGEITLRLLQEGNRRGIEVVASDEGPGIPDVARAMQDGYSTGRSMGLGLPGAKRLMDEFEIVSEVNKGTTVTAKKWLQ